MPSIAIIYLLTNKITQKRYVGFTTNLPRRLKAHPSRAKAESHDFILSNSIRKHGWEAFECVILAEHPDAEYAKNVLEPHFIEEMNTFYENGHGYNMTWGGEGTLGYKRTPEQCARISQGKKGQKLSVERRKQMSEQSSGENNSNYGKTHSPETRAKISAGIRLAHKEGRCKPCEWTPERKEKLRQANKDRVCTPETRAKMREAHRDQQGHPHTEEHKAYMSRCMKGRIFTEETLLKMRLSTASFLWTVRSPDGLVYETYSLDRFCQHHDVDPKTIVKKLKARQEGRVMRKSVCHWVPLAKVPITDEMRKPFQTILDSCWRIVEPSPTCKTISDSNPGASSAITAPEPKTSI